MSSPPSNMFGRVTLKARETYVEKGDREWGNRSLLGKK